MKVSYYKLDYGTGECFVEREVERGVATVTFTDSANNYGAPVAEAWHEIIAAHIRRYPEDVTAAFRHWQQEAA